MKSNNKNFVTFDNSNNNDLNIKKMRIGQRFYESVDYTNIKKQSEKTGNFFMNRSIDQNKFDKNHTPYIMAPLFERKKLKNKPKY